MDGFRNGGKVCVAEVNYLRGRAIDVDYREIQGTRSDRRL